MEDKKEIFRDIIAKCNCGDKELEHEAKDRMMVELGAFIGSVIKSYYPTYIKDHYDDMFNSGVVGLMIGIRSYNPDLSMPTTYFEPFILHEVSEYVNKYVKGITSYYANNLKKINTAIQAFQRDGKQYTMNDIAIECSMPVESVQRAISMQETSAMIYFENTSFLDTEAEKAGHFNASPEDNYLQNEKTEKIFDALNQYLNRQEKEITMRSFGLAGFERESAKTISEQMGISIAKVRRFKATALRKLQSVKSLENFFNYNTKRENYLSEEISLANSSCGDVLIHLLDDDTFLDF